MPATKTARTLLASVSNGAGSGTNGNEWNLSTAYGGLACAKVTNGATGPTVACDFVVYVGESTGTKREFSRQTANLGNNVVTEFAVEVPPSAMFVNTRFENNTVQPVTVEAYGQELTTL